MRRVAERVRLGGHAVPPDIIRRRYERGLANFLTLYSPIADWWDMYDNSATTRLVAERTAGRPVRAAEPELWGRIMKQMEAREEERAYRAEEGESIVMGVSVSQITEAIREAGRDAWRRHKALGHPIVIWRDGKVVVVPPEEIEL